MTKHATLRHALGGGTLLTAMAAHNPLTAKLAEEAGFGAIWGSGFELSASYAVPDANILSMGTHLDMMRAIASVVTVPLIADLDTGYGNAVNVAYIVPQYEAAGVSAVGAMRKVFAQIRADGGIAGVDRDLPSVADIIDLQGDAHMRALEARFLR